MLYKTAYSFSGLCSVNKHLLYCLDLFIHISFSEFPIFLSTPKGQVGHCHPGDHFKKWS